jgi:bromodomain-containing factor 1
LFQDQNDIEIDMDVLPPAALIKLYDFVIRPKSTPAVAKPRTGRPPIATGGLKRKSMDEAAEAERIKALEARVSMFEKAGGGANGHTNGVARPIPAVNDSGHSSDSESGSSGSDSGSESE